MTTDELRAKFNNEFGLDKWPLSYEVDIETYANVCQSIFESNQIVAESISIDATHVVNIVNVLLGPNKGILFKGVELILRKG